MLSLLGENTDWQKGFDLVDDEDKIDEGTDGNPDQVDAHQEISWPSDFKEDISKVFTNVLEDSNRRFKAVDGREIEFTQEERDYILAKLPQDLLRLSKKILLATLQVVNQSELSLDETMETEGLVDAITSIADLVITTKSQSKKNQIVGTVYLSDTRRVEVIAPGYVFDRETRLEAAKLLSRVKSGMAGYRRNI